MFSTLLSRAQFNHFVRSIARLQNLIVFFIISQYWISIDFKILLLMDSEFCLLFNIVLADNIVLNWIFVFVYDYPSRCFCSHKLIILYDTSPKVSIYSHKYSHK